MTKRTLRVTLPVCAAIVAAGAWPATAGPLDPPPGEIAPTGRFGPRTEISSYTTPGDADSSFKITEPGSYYLPGNITGEAGKSGIEIAANGVTLDLNGFALLGVADSLDGISIPDAQSDVAICNGTLRDWGGHGLNAANANYSRFEGLRADNNGANGLVAGQGFLLTHCTAGGNTGSGINAGPGSAISYCTARDNSGQGIYAGHGSTIIGCAAYNNSSNGISGGQGTSVISCTAYVNRSNGISIDSGSAISCTANQNTNDGITTDAGCLVKNCNVWDNRDDGIDVEDGSIVQNCNAYQNDGSGIYGRGSPIRIEDNHVVSNGTGIESNGFNFIVRNYAQGNATSYDFEATDRYGQIITPTPGFSSSNAWANFEN